MAVAGARSSGDRAARLASRRRKPTWTRAPLRIVRSECIVCDECVRACPPEFAAIARHGVTLVVLPELCSGCDKCLPVCPVDCIVANPTWQPSPDAWWQQASGAGSAR